MDSQYTNKGITAIIFDLDGVIVSTDELHYRAWKALADTFEIPFNRNINNRLRGVGRMDCLEIILENHKGEPFSQEKKIEMAEWKNNKYREYLKSMSPADVSDEVKEVLKYLKKKGYRISLGSASKNAKYILGQTGLLFDFDVVSDGNNITRSKPDPEVFQKAADMLGKTPEECLVVEDAVSGIIAGHAGGMQTAAIGDAVSCDLADYKLNKLSDLLMFL